MCGGKNKIKGYPSKYKEEPKGDILIINLWMQSMESIHNMHVVDTDATSYQSKYPKKCLETSEKEKKNKYIDACRQKCQHFTTFVVSVDALIGVKEEMTLKYINTHLT